MPREIDSLECGGGDFERLALRDKEVPGKPALHLHNVGFCSKVQDFLSEDNFSGGHGWVRERLKMERMKIEMREILESPR